MGACDAGRCCKGSACTDDKKCCCQAKSGNFAVGEVCRTASCNTGGSCFNNVPVCECLAGGGSLTQSCDPCDGYVCDAGACLRCVVVNGQPTCVSFCTDLCSPCVNGACIPKQCQVCEQCIAGACISTGTPCGSAPNIICCQSGQCCVNGQCVTATCPSPCGPCELCVCGTCVYQSGAPCGALCCQGTTACCDNTACCEQGRACCAGVCCPAGQRCCNNVCKECCNNGDCPSGKVCSNGVCVTPSCCIEVPACAPQSISTRSPCENYTFDFMGDPCTVTAIPVNCSSSQCAYTWDGVAWAFDGCAIITSQGPILVATATPGCGCTGAGCASPSGLSPGATEGERRYVGNCADVSNPLP